MTDVQNRTMHVSGFQAGIGGNIQIRIALEEMRQRSGTATMQQIYDAVEAEMRKRNDSYRLSEQGKASLRYFVNRSAVRSGYVKRAVDGSGWQNTPEGEKFVTVSDEDSDDVPDNADLSISSNGIEYLELVRRAER